MGLILSDNLFFCVWKQLKINLTFRSEKNWFTSPSHNVIKKSVRRAGWPVRSLLSVIWLGHPFQWVGIYWFIFLHSREYRHQLSSRCSSMTGTAFDLDSITRPLRIPDFPSYKISLDITSQILALVLSFFTDSLAPVSPPLYKMPDSSTKVELWYHLFKLCQHFSVTCLKFPSFLNPCLR